MCKSGKINMVKIEELSTTSSGTRAPTDAFFNRKRKSFARLDTLKASVGAPVSGKRPKTPSSGKRPKTQTPSTYILRILPVFLGYMVGVMGFVGGFIRYIEDHDCECLKSQFLNHPHICGIWCENGRRDYVCNNKIGTGDNEFGDVNGNHSARCFKNPKTCIVCTYTHSSDDECILSGIQANMA